MAKYEIKDGAGIIPEGTIEIETDAFAGCVDLKSITIPSSVTTKRYASKRYHSGFQCGGHPSFLFGFFHGWDSGGHRGR